jgi:hypothetical protein
MSHVPGAANAAHDADSAIISAPVDALEFVRESPAIADALALAK